MNNGCSHCTQGLPQMSSLDAGSAKNGEFLDVNFIFIAQCFGDLVVVYSLSTYQLPRLGKQGPHFRYHRACCAADEPQK